MTLTTANTIGQFLTDYVNFVNSIGTPLSASTANTTYLKKVEANTTYLKKVEANTTYLKKSEANTTYLKKSEANTTYLKRTNGVASGLLLTSTTPSSANSVVSKAWVGANYTSNTYVKTNFTSNTYAQATFLKSASNPVIVTSISIGTGSANTVINSGGVYGGSQTLTDGATINWDGDNGHIATVTLGGNRTFANMTNPRVGYYLLHIIQDGTGSRTLSWGSIYKWPGGVAPVLTTTASARDLITFICDGTNMYGTYVNDVK